MAFGVGTYRPSGGPLVDILLHDDADTDIQVGDLVMALADGYGYSGAVDDADPETTNAELFGVAVEEGGAYAVGKKVRCDIGGAIVLLTHTAGSQAQADVGDPVFVDGAQAVDLTGGMTDQVPAGHIVAIESATKVWVKLKPYGATS